MKLQKTRILLLALILCVAGLAACNDEGNIIGSGGNTPTTDYSNIENLYEQPLDVIQKAVQGKWVILELGGDYTVPTPYKNTFANITKDTVFIIKDESDLFKYSYKWEEKEMSWYGITGYVMMLNEPSEGWLFNSIRNDTLYGMLYGPLGSFKFLRIKDGDK